MGQRTEARLESLDKREHKLRLFEWQGGYADFSVSYSNIESVRQYIANQGEYHKKMDFKEELRLLLKKHEVDWDERYIWE